MLPACLPASTPTIVLIVSAAVPHATYVVLSLLFVVILYVCDAISADAKRPLSFIQPIIPDSHRRLRSQAVYHAYRMPSYRIVLCVQARHPRYIRRSLAPVVRTCVYNQYT